MNARMTDWSDSTVLVSKRSTSNSRLHSACPCGGVCRLCRNVFCPTGPGGGVDASCSPGGKVADADPNCDPCYTPKVKALLQGRAARVGVPANSVPPPPPIGRLPNLTDKEREVEGKFADAYEADPDKMASNFRQLVHATTKPGDPPTFGTDDAKALTDAWSHPDQATRALNRATLNLALHQTANAVAKRAFLQELDTLKKGDELLVTVGGCGAGKGYSLKNVPQALEVKGKCKAVWDSAGDQNATENPWIQREAEKRGLKVNYVYVHADPETQWAHPDRGVVKRAQDPADGRMVDAKVFADSYALGAKNHQTFYEKNKDNKSANFIFLDGTTKPKPSLVDGIPEKAFEVDRKELADFANKSVKASGAPDHIISGATAGERIWHN